MKKCEKIPLPSVGQEGGLDGGDAAIPFFGHVQEVFLVEFFAIEAVHALKMILVQHRNSIMGAAVFLRLDIGGKRLRIGI